MSDRDLPPLLAFDDQLDRIERDADADVADEIDSIRARLDEYDERENGATASILDDLANLVARMREQLSGDADRWAEAIQNRITQFRNSLNERSETLALASPQLRDEYGEADVSELGDEQATFDATLVNSGEEGAGLVRVSFYDGDGGTVRVVDLPQGRVASGEQREISTTMTIPAGATYYDAAALDAEETTAV